MPVSVHLCAANEEPKMVVDPAFSPLVICPFIPTVMKCGQDEVIDLTKKELTFSFSWLKTRTVSSEEKKSWKRYSYGYAGKTNIVDVYIRYLRSKIDEKVGKKYIHTVRGIGYAARD